MERWLAAFRASPAWCLLRRRDFALLWSGETVSQIGDGLNKVALLWFAYQTSHSALRTSLIGVLQTVPPLALGPVIGVYLDRLPKKKTMIVINLLHGALVALIPLLYGFGLLSLPLLYALVLVISIVSAFYGPALMTALPLVASPTELRPANALIQGTSMIGVLLGPVVAGFGISVLGIADVLYADALTFVFLVVCMAFVRVRAPENAPSVPGCFADFARSLREGLDFLLRRRRGILFLTLVSGLQNLGASAFLFLLPAVVRKDLALDALSLGFIWSAFGAGMLLATALIALLKLKPRTLLHVVFAALVLGGFSIGGLAYVKSKFAAAALMVAIGFSAAAFNPVVITLLQDSTPEGLRARVLTAFNTATTSMAMLGMLGFGWAADRVGQNPAMIAIGGVLLSTAVALMLVSRVSSARELLLHEGV
ncbi:MAG TPA: MFS transporter [Polyangiaceae bacterium]|nr:MFS transporter [Polyangiaceae bacterium]